MNMSVIKFIIASTLILLFSTAYSSDNNGEIMLLGSALHGKSARLNIRTVAKNLLTSYKTVNPYDNKTHSYEGILLKNLSKTYCGGCKTIIFSAYDGYQVTFTDKEWNKYAILMAFKTDGVYLDIAHSGPARVIMPYSDYPELGSEKNMAKWIWLIKSIEFK